jgi:hypothetical protein
MEKAFAKAMGNYETVYESGGTPGEAFDFLLGAPSSELHRDNKTNSEWWDYLNHEVSQNHIILLETCRKHSLLFTE